MQHNLFLEIIDLVWDNMRQGCSFIATSRQLNESRKDWATVRTDANDAELSQRVRRSGVHPASAADFLSRRLKSKYEISDEIIALARLCTLVESDGGSFAYLAAVYEAKGDFKSRAATLQHGLSAYPDDELLAHRARLAIERPRTRQHVPGASMIPEREHSALDMDADRGPSRSSGSSNESPPYRRRVSIFAFAAFLVGLTGSALVGGLWAAVSILVGVHLSAALGLWMVMLGSPVGWLFTSIVAFQTIGREAQSFLERYAGRRTGLLGGTLAWIGSIMFAVEMITT